MKGLKGEYPELKKVDITYLEGNIQGEDHKNMGYVNIYKVKEKTKVTSPDYYGFVLIKGAGRFAISLWEKQGTKVITSCNQTVMEKEQ